MEELKRIVNRYHMTKDDLIMEAELVENEGEYIHIGLMGFSPAMMRSLADTM